MPQPRFESGKVAGSEQGWRRTALGIYPARPEPQEGSIPRKVKAALIAASAVLVLLFPGSAFGAALGEAPPPSTDVPVVPAPVAPPAPLTGAPVLPACVATQVQFQSYAEKVYLRARITKKARRLLARFKDCAVSPAARINMVAVEKKLARDRRLTGCGRPKCNIRLGRMLSAARGWIGQQFTCLVGLWNRESGWRVEAYNGGSGAGGIPQALPMSKMIAYGRDYLRSARTQIRWGLAYIAGRYRVPCGAKAHSDAMNWY